MAIGHQKQLSLQDSIEVSVIGCVVVTVAIADR